MVMGSRTIKTSLEATCSLGWEREGNDLGESARQGRELFKLLILP